MSKIDIIDYCGDCSDRYYKDSDMRCEITDKITHENSPIPDWCPKPNAPGIKLPAEFTDLVKAFLI